MSKSFNKKEKLKSEKIIGQLFDEGSSVSQFPLRLFYLKSSFSEDIKFKIAVSVSKKNMKKAVDRNRIKRLLRESYRLNKCDLFNNTSNQYALMVLYLGKDIPDFNLINVKLKLLLASFLLL